MNNERYELLKNSSPTLAKIWKSAVESFPDENLRNYFKDFDKFYEFYNKMNKRFHNEEVRFIGLFDIFCPELKDIASNASRETEGAIEIWSGKVGWI